MSLVSPHNGESAGQESALLFKLHLVHRYQKNPTTYFPAPGPTLCKNVECNCTRFSQRLLGFCRAPGEGWFDENDPTLESRSQDLNEGLSYSQYNAQ